MQPYSDCYALSMLLETAKLINLQENAIIRDEHFLNSTMEIFHTEDTNKASGNINVYEYVCKCCITIMKYVFCTARQKDIIQINIAS